MLINISKNFLKILTIYLILLLFGRQITDMQSMDLYIYTQVKFFIFPTFRYHGQLHAVMPH